MLSEEEAAFQLAKVKTRMDQMAKNAQEAYQTEWGNTQFGRKAGAKPNAGMSQQDAEALAWANANPSDPRAAKIRAKLGAK